MDHYLYFDDIKEHRGFYFVHYQPPVADHRFAVLSIVFIEQVSRERVIEIMDNEIWHWMGRYPVPLMVWVNNDREDILEATHGKGGCVVAWISPETGEISQSANIEDLSRFLKENPSHPDWRSIYSNLPVRTDAEVKAAAQKRLSEHAQQVKFLKLALMLWLAVIPAGYAIFEFLGPEWLGLMGLSFVLWKALKTVLMIYGIATPSARQKAGAKKNSKMREYFYHCERNPDGFRRLKMENLESDARERVHNEFQSIKTSSNKEKH